jgi:hypothetical protein
MAILEGIKLVPFVQHTASLGDLTPERGQAGLNLTKRCSYPNICRACQNPRWQFRFRQVTTAPEP